MSVFDRVIKAFRPAPPQPAQPTQKAEAWIPAGVGQSVGIDMANASLAALWNKWGAATAAITDIAVYACVSAISEVIGGAKWRVVDDAGATLGTSEDMDSDEPLTALLLDATKEGDGTSLFYSWAENLYITGENFLYLATDSSGRLCELVNLNSLRTDVYAPNDVVAHYTYNGRGRSLTLPLDTVVFDRLRGNLFTDVRGYSPVMTAIASYTPQIMQAAGRTIYSYFVNDGMPGSAISPDPAVEKEWNNNQLDYIRLTMQGNKSAGGKFKTAVFPYPYKAEVFQQPDVQKWAQLLEAVRPDIYRAYRVSPVIAGDVTTPYQNSDENRINFHQLVLSRLRAIAMTVNAHIMPRIYGGQSGRVFEFDLTPFRHIDPQERQAAKDLFTFGIATGNELREAYGWKPVDTAEVRFDPASGGNVPAAQALTAPVATPQLTAGNPETEKADGGVMVALELADAPDLIDLQNRVKTMVGDAPAEWSDPSTFHVTLAYSPTADDAAAQAMVEAVRAMDIPAMELNIGSLASFDKLGQNAAHLRIRRNAPLLAYQADLVDSLTGAGVPLSAFSDPLKYIPHITLGYVQGQAPKATFHSRLMVSPKGVVVKRGDEVLYSSNATAQVDEIDAYAQAARNGTVMKRAFVWKAIDTDTGELINREVLDAAPDERRAVINDWRKSILARLGVTDYATKSRDELPMPVRLALKTWRDAGVTEADAHKAAAELYAVIVGRKSISQEQNRFETAAFQLFRRAQLERMTKAAFTSQMTALVIKYHQPLMLLGYADGGIADHELTKRDSDWLVGYADEARAAVAKVADELFADEQLTDAEIKGKPRMWWNLSVNGAYNEGLARAAKDGLGRFIRGNTSDSCADCRGLDGRAYRFSEWFNALGRKLVPCNATECGGFNCKCRIVPYRGKRTPGSIPRLRGSRKSEHVLEFESEAVFA